MPSPSPKLWVVATPLGNPGDLSPRAREVLSSASLILAEDTRRAGLLFQRLGLTCAGSMISSHEHNEEARLAPVLEALEQGGDVALISDAGAPLMSDPGYRLVRACREAGVPVSPVPGPTAPVTALMAAGLPPYPFTFLGFLPHGEGDRRKLFAAWANPAAPRTTLVFFERKNRLRETLACAFEELGPREACVARELTKVHEEFILVNLEDWQTVPDDLKGEITVVVGPPPKDEHTDRAVVLALAREEAAVGGKPRQIARRVKDRVAGWSVSDIYDLMREEGE